MPVAAVLGKGGVSTPRVTLHDEQIGRQVAKPAMIMRTDLPDLRHTQHSFSKARS
jgi:hypothetical protein